MYVGGVPILYTRMCRQGAVSAVGLSLAKDPLSDAYKRKYTGLGWEKEIDDRWRKSKEMEDRIAPLHHCQHHHHHPNQHHDSGSGGIKGKAGEGIKNTLLSGESAVGLAKGERKSKQDTQNSAGNHMFGHQHRQILSLEMLMRVLSALLLHQGLDARILDDHQLFQFRDLALQNLDGILQFANGPLLFKKDLPIHLLVQSMLLKARGGS